MIKEACVENFTDIPSVIRKGANRIELCDNLAVGGTTASYGVMKKAVSYCRSKSIPVMAIIRPRGGDFYYSSEEKEIMRLDLEMAIQTGVSGIVIGALNENSEPDIPFLEEMLYLTKQANIDATFHMAFDEIPEEKQASSISLLSRFGFSRILTHGGPKSASIQECIPRLGDLITLSQNKLIILPGGGVTKENLPLLQKELNIKEAHGTKIV